MAPKRETIDIDALKRERMRVLQEAGELLSAANQEDRELAMDEQKKYDDLMKEAKRRLTQIKNEEEMRFAEGANDERGQPLVKAHPSDSPSYIGMTKEDTRKFSIRRLIAAKAGLISRKEAAFELEVSDAVGKRNGKGDAPDRVYIPFEVTAGMEQRDLTVGTEGTDIVEATHGGLIELLRNRMVTRAAGVRTITGLRGDLHLPKRTATNSNTAWVAEGVAPTEGVSTFGQVKYSPSQLASYTDITRQTLLQTSFDVEQEIRNDLATNLAIELDRTVLHGSGAGTEPAGVFNTSSIGDVAAGTSGGAPTWANIVELETDVSVANADQGSLAYITNSKVRGKLKTTERVSSTGLFIWQDPANLAPATPGTPLNGYRAFVTNQVRSDFTKGSGSSLSSIFFGNWEEGGVAIWADIEIIVDPFSQAHAGVVRLVSLAFADFQVRHPESFSVMKDAAAG